MPSKGPSDGGRGGPGGKGNDGQGGVAGGAGNQGGNNSEGQNSSGTADNSGFGGAGGGPGSGMGIGGGSGYGGPKGGGGGEEEYNGYFYPTSAPVPVPVPGMFKNLEEAGVYGAQQAYDQYNLGPVTPYDGTGVSGFGTDSTNAYNSIRGLANQGNPFLAGATNQVSGITTASNPYVNKFNANHDGINNPYQQGFTAQSTAVNPFLQGFNDFSGQQNEFLDSINQRGMNDIQDRMNSQFGGSGRSNSVYHSDSIGRSLGDYSANLYGNAYDSQQDRNLQALVGGSNAYNSQTANQLAAMNSGSGAYENQNTQRLNALQAGSDAYNSQIGRQLQAAEMLPGLNDAKYDDARMLIGVGQAQDYMSQMQLDDKIKRHDIAQNSGWNNLQNYMDIINGLSPTQQPPVQQQQEKNSTLDSLGTIASIIGGFGF